MENICDKIIIFVDCALNIISYILQLFTILYMAKVFLISTEGTSKLYKKITYMSFLSVFAGLYGLFYHLYIDFTLYCVDNAYKIETIFCFSVMNGMIYHLFVSKLPKKSKPFQKIIGFILRKY